VPCYIKETNEHGKRFKHKRQYTDKIPQLSNHNIFIKHVDVMHYFCHLIRANENRNTQLINAVKKLEAFLVFADYLFLVIG